MNPIKARQIIDTLSQNQASKRLAEAIPRRASRLTKQSDCCLCTKPIKVGQMYRDGGTNNRAHDPCVKE